jgi:hypothetical protein
MFKHFAIVLVFEKCSLNALPYFFLQIWLQEEPAFGGRPLLAVGDPWSPHKERKILEFKRKKDLFSIDYVLGKKM